MNKWISPVKLKIRRQTFIMNIGSLRLRAFPGKKGLPGKAASNSFKLRVRGFD